MLYAVFTSYQSETLGEIRTNIAGAVYKDKMVAKKVRDRLRAVSPNCFVGKASDPGPMYGADTGCCDSMSDALSGGYNLG